MGDFSSRMAMGLCKARGFQVRKLKTHHSSQQAGLPAAALQGTLHRSHWHVGCIWGGDTWPQDPSWTRPGGCMQHCACTISCQSSCLRKDWFLLGRGWTGRARLGLEWVRTALCLGLVFSL